MSVSWHTYRVFRPRSVQDTLRQHVAQVVTTKPKNQHSLDPVYLPEAALQDLFPPTLWTCTHDERPTHWLDDSQSKVRVTFVCHSIDALAQWLAFHEVTGTKSHVHGNVKQLQRGSFAVVFAPVTAEWVLCKRTWAESVRLVFGWARVNTAGNVEFSQTPRNFWTSERDLLQKKVDVMQSLRQSISSTSIFGVGVGQEVTWSKSTFVCPVARYHLFGDKLKELQDDVDSYQSEDDDTN